MNYLTSLRGIAAFLVVLFHIKQFLANFYYLAPFNSVFASGYLAVDFFFVLSGFIIAYKYQTFFSGTISRKDVHEFLAKRIARIYPLHFFVLMLFLGVQILLFATGREYGGDEFSVQHFFFKLFLIDLWTFNDSSWQSWNVPSWTISGEWFAYLVFPALVFVLARLPAWGKVLLLCSATLVLMFAYDSKSCGSVGSCIGKLGLFRCLVGFALGVGVYNARQVLSKWHTSVSVGLFVVAMSVLFVDGYFRLENYWVIPSMFALALLGGLGFTSPLHNFLESKPLVYLGDISYSVYLTHAFVEDILYKIFMHNGAQPSIYFIGIYLVATLVFSSATYEFVEVPARKGLFRLLRAPVVKPS